MNPSTANPGCSRKCFEYSLAKSASSPNRDELTTDTLLVNMKNHIFPVISTVIIPKMLTICYPVELETLNLIYWNIYVAL